MTRLPGAIAEHLSSEPFVKMKPTVQHRKAQPCRIAQCDNLLLSRTSHGTCSSNCHAHAAHRMVMRHAPGRSIQLARRSQQDHMCRQLLCLQPPQPSEAAQHLLHGGLCPIARVQWPVLKVLHRDFAFHQTKSRQNLTAVIVISVPSNGKHQGPGQLKATSWVGESLPF